MRRSRRIPARALPQGVRIELAAYTRRAGRRGPLDFAETAPAREIEAGFVRFGAAQLVVGLTLSYGGVSLGFEVLRGEPISVLNAALFLFGLILGLVSAWFNPYGASPSAAFLASALPHLRLSAGDRRVAEALVAGKDPATIDRLRGFAEAEAQLDALGRRLGEDPTQEIVRERDALRAQHEAARDPAARAAFAESLAFIESRLATAEDERPLRERLAAHRAMLDQASRSLSNEKGMVEGEATATEAEPLLARIGDLSAEVAAHEAAAREMRAL